jgi:hypothetical protein
VLGVNFGGAAMPEWSSSAAYTVLAWLLASSIADTANVSLLSVRIFIAGLL